MMAIEGEGPPPAGQQQLAEGTPPAAQPSAPAPGQGNVMGQRSFEEGAGLFDAATLPAEHQAAVAAALAANPAVDMGQAQLELGAGIVDPAGPPPAAEPSLQGQGQKSFNGGKGLYNASTLPAERQAAVEAAVEADPAANMGQE